MNVKMVFESVVSIAVAASASAEVFALGTSDELEARGVKLPGTVVREVERREFNDGLAVRYVLPEGARRIEREDTIWRLPGDAKVWFQGTDWRGYVDYESPYSSMFVKDIPEGQLMALPVTAKMPDGTYRLLTEANVADYTDLAVTYRGDGIFEATFYADREGFDRDGTEPATPWRIMLTAKDLQTLATSDIVRRLCPEPPPERARRVREEFAPPGRSIWQWLPAGAPVYAEQRRWFDRTKELGYEYYLIDEGWRDWGDDTTRWEKLKSCIDYGNSIGVKSFVWVDSKEMRTAEARRAYLARARAAGAVGIKIDFIPPPSCATMKWYEETLRDTYDAGLVVDFHGCVKPTGREKTWPHEYAREAIRGHEWHITRYGRVLDWGHDTILPFNRLVQGHADYTPVVFEKKELIRYTWARELAQGIIFAARFLCLGDFPENYLANPARDVIASYPCEYDETRILPGSEIGECAAIARRKGGVWFVAVENGGTERTLELDFSFLSAPATMRTFADVPGRLDACVRETRRVAPGEKMSITLSPGGGFVAVTDATAY